MFDREMHTAFVRVTGEMPRLPSQMWVDIRRGRRRIWGSLFRAIDEAVGHGASLADVYAIIEVFEWYALDAFQDRIDAAVRRQRSA